MHYLLLVILPNASTYLEQYFKSNYIISSKLSPSAEKNYHRLTKKHRRHIPAAVDNKTLRMRKTDFYQEA